jgi:hypothetical protein
VKKDGGGNDGATIDRRIRSRQRSGLQVEDAVGERRCDGECIVIEPSVRENSAWESREKGQPTSFSC